MLAYGFGADYLEQDVVATRDGELVVLHDLELDAVSNVAERYPARARADGHHYAIDFDLAELKQLHLTERRNAHGEPVFEGRFRPRHSRFRIVTLERELELVRELNRLTGRNVGIYPEIKHAAFHREHGIELGARLVEALARHGYTSAADRVFIQCFDAAELEALRAAGTRLPLVRLVEAGHGTAAATAGGVAAVGCAYTDLVDIGADGLELTATPLARTLRAAGTAVHAYTLRSDAPGAFRGGFETLLEFLYRDVRIAGVFTDHPDVALRVRERCAPM